MFAFFSLYYCIFHPILIEYNFEYAFYFKSNINLTTIYLLDKKEIYMPVNIGDICIFEGITGEKNQVPSKGVLVANIFNIHFPLFLVPF